MIEFFFPDIKTRSKEIELMDIPTSDEKKLINTVKQFRILNILFTRSRGLIKKYFIPDLLKFPGKTHSFLDIGAGGCDIALWLLKYCKRRGLKVKISCLDNDKRITDYSREKCKSVNEIKIIAGSAFDLKQIGKFDYIFANHFLHHLPSEVIPEILDIISQQTERAFLLNDIFRSRLAYFWYTIFTGLFMHNSFSFYDGRLSIKRGFTYQEMKRFTGLLDKSTNVNVFRTFPARIYVVGLKKYYMDLKGD